MARKEATPEYLKELKNKLEHAKVDLTLAKVSLYKYTSMGKLFEEEFELARLQCIQATDKLMAIQREIGRVELALLDLPELPFEEE
jgi:hypothetical protein